MLRNLIFTALLFAMSYCNVNISGQNIQNSKSTASGEGLIKISAPGYRWLKISYTEYGATYSSEATSFTQARCEILYENLNYKKNKVKVAMYTVFVNEGVELEEKAIMAEQEIETSSGTLHAFFVLQNVKFEGIGEMKIFLTDKKENIISNIIILPCAAGEEAIKELEEKLGPGIIKKTE